MGNRHSDNKVNFKFNINKYKLKRDNKASDSTTPGNTKCNVTTQNKSKSLPKSNYQIKQHNNNQNYNNQNYNNVTVYTYQIQNSNNNNNASHLSNNNNNNNNNETCLWFKISIKNKEHTNEKKCIEGIYRKVQFIDTMLQSQTKGNENMNIIQNMNEYGNHYTSHRNVYIKIYNKQQKQLDQKKENIFLWHDGIKWILSNYNTLYYYLDNINAKKRWVIKPETNVDNILISLSNKYSNDLNILKQTHEIIFKNVMYDTFEITVNNFYGKHYGKHQQQFQEDPSLRNAYCTWRDNLNVIYQRNQLFTMNQLINEEKQNHNKREAKDIRNVMNEINDICLSMEFRKLLKKYKHKSIKVVGWKNKGQIDMDINDNTYSEFYKMYINNQTDKQLSNMNIRDVVLQFHKYYYQLFSELNELDQFEQGQVTYR